MTSNSGDHDLSDSSDDTAPGASHSRQSLLQKISLNTEMKLSWAEQLEELEKDGVSVDQKVIVSGPEKPSEANEANEAGRKDPRLIIPRNLSDYPGFPADMNKFGSATEFGQAVIMFWAKWRKQVKKSKAKAKKAEGKKRIADQNDRVVGLGSGGGRNRASNDNGSSRDRRRDRNQSSNRDQRNYEDRRRESRTSNVWPRRDGWHSGRESRVNSRKTDEGRKVDEGHKRAEDSFGFDEPNAKEISPDLILPLGEDIEVGIIRERINQLPIELLRDKHVIQDCRSESIGENGKFCEKKNLEFWKDFIKDDFGLKTFNDTKKRAPLLPQHKVFQQQQQRDLTARSDSLKKAGGGSASVKRPLHQQQPYQQKKPRQDPVPEEFLPFAVYVEKFDDEKNLVKMLGKEFDAIKTGIMNAYWLESFAFKSKVKNDVDRRLFSSKRGVATFFAKSELAQAFIINTINNLVQLPGVKARGPRVESKPNLHVFFPAALGPGISPEVAMKELLLMHANVECEPVVRHVKTWSHGRTVDLEIPNEKLAELVSWGLDNDVHSFGMLCEKLPWWTSFNPSSASLKASKEAEEVTAPDHVMIEVASVTATETLAAVANLTTVESAAASASAEPMEVESKDPAMTLASPKPSIGSAASATAALSAKMMTQTEVSIKPAPPTVLAAITASPAEAATPAPATTSTVALASFKFCGPLKASEEAVETKPHDLSSLQLLEDYNSGDSSDDEVRLRFKKDDPESETEDGEVKDAAPNTSTPIDLAKSLEKGELRARELARRKLELSPPKNKVCIKLKDSVLEAEPRPRRSCAINSYLTDNYVLPSTKIVPKPAVANERRSSSLLVTSKRRLDKNKAKAESPSITTFLKPRVALSEGFKNDAGEPKEALNKSQLDNLVSQKLISEFFPKN